MKKIILFILAAIILIGAFGAWKIFGPTVTVPEGKYFYIRTGENYASVKKNISEKKIAGGFWLDIVVKRLKYDKKVKPGRYEIKKGMSLFELVRMLRNGNQSPVNFVIIKFRTKEEFAKKSGTLFECDSLEMINYLNNSDSLSKFGLDTTTVMTAIIPNTYTYFWNNTAKKIFEKLFDESNKFWTEERKQKAADHGLSTKQVYILASIVEEETTKKSDKGNIASVYMNRIAIGMPLQADPTIKYSMKNFELRRIYEKYLTYPSPYNTYLNKGLPPGPICTPSVETIDEVLNSPKTNYLYFVASSTFDGSHVFTSSYNEHLKKAKEYQKALNELEAARKSK